MGKDLVNLVNINTQESKEKPGSLRSKVEIKGTDMVECQTLENVGCISVQLDWHTCQEYLGRDLSGF
jgi:hypothetical protein